MTSEDSSLQTQLAFISVWSSRFLFASRPVRVTSFRPRGFRDAPTTHHGQASHCNIDEGVSRVLNLLLRWFFSSSSVSAPFRTVKVVNKVFHTVGSSLDSLPIQRGRDTPAMHVLASLGLITIERCGAKTSCPVNMTTLGSTAEQMTMMDTCLIYLLHLFGRFADWPTKLLTFL